MTRINRIGGSRSPVGSAKAVDKQLPARPKSEVADDDGIPAEINEALSILRNSPDNQNLNMQYQYDQESGEVYVIIDDGKGKRIRRQVPKEELLRLAKLKQAGRRQVLDRLA